ncbi:hypothetical protein ACQR5V_21600 [Xanthomonas oryzae pv. oryzicola]|uniref:hypothetical protein n=1 Tax=Xanthomonas oryzae TaxID=347 RepID=UPI0005CE09C1|nr:hypothetical protein [Xanthomonas oryzae]AJQ88084.1 hypothetical protein BE73_14275 [Xanthomonas oryzae pv. oryzicola]AVU02472.1 hypothetical protein C0L90_08425 [Xanthomonas oryzae pv. oryzae]OWB26827.1 hypothetical protein XocBAI21_17350 [Xanthomonas oryzae pv. oryzicola]QBI15670.1 hypothetical protein EYR03_08475 [Xanthomonas oryzae pv. oryzae]QBI15728.1 hypothetical protein EYR03_08795 [Xanthomonas oryzae pv. oryzae]
MSAFWFLLGAVIGLVIRALLALRENTGEMRTFHTLEEAQAWALEMQDAGYTPSIRCEVRCTRRTEDFQA